MTYRKNIRMEKHRGKRGQTGNTGIEKRRMQREKMIHWGRGKISACGFRLAGMVLAAEVLFAGCGRQGETLTFPVAGSGLQTEALQEVDSVAITEQETLEDLTVYVHVCGAVLTPCVVHLPAGSRGWDAVQAAGGFTEEAAETAVNLAAVLTDGMQLYVPTQEEAAGRAEISGDAPTPDGRVNINTADVSGLCTLPGIGEAKAEDIVKYREQNGSFKSPEDIMLVPGIKEGAYNKLKDKIVVN